MSGLKRSQKFCPKCNEKNFIRQFFCKKCHYEFPKKDKSSIHNSSIEQFFFKMTISDDNKKSNKIKKNKKEINDINIIDLIELDEENESNLIKDEEKKKN